MSLCHVGYLAMFGTASNLIKGIARKKLHKWRSIMKIGSSIVAMVSNHVKEDTHTEVEGLRVWIDPPLRLSAIDTVQLSEKVKSLYEDKESKRAALDAEEVIKDDPKLFIVKRLIEALTGREIEICKRPETGECPQDVTVTELSTTDTPEQSNRVGWGIRYEYHKTYSEKEETAFTTGGIIKTADGQAGTIQQIDVAV